MPLKTLKASIWDGIKPVEFDRQTEHFLFNAAGRTAKAGKFEAYFEHSLLGFDDAKAFLIAYHRTEYERAKQNQEHARRMAAQSIKKMEEISQCQPPNL